MIKNTQLMPLEFYKKSAFTGGYQGMRYRIVKEEGEFLAAVWPEPYNFDTTDNSKKEYERFPFSEEGKQQMTDWLNQKYNDGIEKWSEALGNF